MLEKYDLKRMLDEIEKDKDATGKKGGRISQDEIKKMIQKSRKEEEGTGK